MLNMKHDLNLPFERFFLGFNCASQDNYPPHNLIKNSDSMYTIELAITGFEKEEVSVIQEGNTLTIEAAHQETKDASSSDPRYLFRGLGQRAFSKKFHLGDYLKVISAKCKNGVLSVIIEQEIPEEKKPKHIKIQ